MAVAASTPIELVKSVYERLPGRVELGRQRLARPLTLTEKILLNHLRDPETGGLERGVSYTDFDPDRIAMPPPQSPSITLVKTLLAYNHVLRIYPAIL